MNTAFSKFASAYQYDAKFTLLYDVKLMINSSRYIYARNVI